MQLKPVILAFFLLLLAAPATSCQMPDPSQLDLIPDLTPAQKHSLHTLHARWRRQSQPLTESCARLSRRIEVLTRSIERLAQNHQQAIDHRFDASWRERYALLAVQNQLHTTLAAAVQQFWQQAKSFLTLSQIHTLDQTNAVRSAAATRAEEATRASR